LVEPPAGIEPATPSLPWNHREPLCESPFPQLAPDRRGRSYRFSFGKGMRSPSNHELPLLAQAISRQRTRAQPTFLPLSTSRSQSGDAPSSAGSMTGHRARTSRPGRPPTGSLQRRPQPATLESLSRPGTTKPSGPVVAVAHRRLHVPDRAAAFAADPTSLDQHRLVWLLILRGEWVAVEVDGTATISELHPKAQHRIGEQSRGPRARPVGSEPARPPGAGPLAVREAGSSRDR
jgi:hypothetical protein